VETPCHVCGQPALGIVPGYAALRQVSSDCRPWPAGARLGVCQACGWVQKALDASWHREVEAIYRGYDIYHQGAGAEQAIFDQDTGAAAARSARLLRAVWERMALPLTGRLLDVGCGNGSLLASCHRLAPDWRLVGHELTAQHRDRVVALPGVEAFCSGPVADIPGQFDVITMNHVLEHVPYPVELLQALWGKLAAGGVLVIQTPNLVRNPFDLLVADHASHMMAGTLARCAAATPFELLVVADDWLPKEITVIARATAAANPPPAPGPARILAFVTECVQWLTTVREQARQAALARPFGLFGTSIAATWLSGELPTAVDFLVDEDTARIGKQHQGRPILSPAQIPAHSQVYLALTPETAQAVARHEAVANAKAHLHLPAPLPPWMGDDRVP